MHKNRKLHIFGVFIVVLFINGCSSPEKGDKFNETIENHKAISLWHDGVWEERYESSNEEYASGPSAIIEILSIDVNKDLSQKDMQEIMDYYEFKNNASFDDKGKYIGKRVNDYTCYVTFFKENTDEVIERYKYQNGKFVTLEKEDESYFARPEEKNNPDEPQSELP